QQGEELAAIDREGDTDRCGAHRVELLARIAAPEVGASESGLRSFGLHVQGNHSTATGAIRATLERPRSRSRPMATSAPRVRSRKEAASMSAEMAFSSGVTRIRSEPKM